MKKEKSKAEAVLEDLEVREVSIVDRPANQRRFLVVKSTDGFSITREDMPMNKGEASDMQEHVSLLDVFGIGVSDQDPGDAGDKDVPDAKNESVTKSKKQTVLEACADTLSGLTTIANELKQAESEHVSDSCKENLDSVLKTLVGDNFTSVVEKALDAKATLAICADAMRSFISIVEKVEALDDSIESIPQELSAEINEVTKSVVSISAVPETDSVSQGVEQPEKAEQQTEEVSKEQETTSDEDVAKPEIAESKPEVEVSKEESEGGDPAVVIKAGAKVSATRLSKLREAYKAISEILAEIDPQHNSAEKVEKEDEGEPMSKEIDFDTVLTPIKETLAGLNEAVEKLATRLDESVEEVSKRVKDLEGVTPAASEEDEPVEVEKKAGGLFSGILGPIVKGR